MDRCEGCGGSMREACDLSRQISAAGLKSCREFDLGATDDDLGPMLIEAVENLIRLGCAFPPGAIYRQIVAQAADPETPHLIDLDLPWDELLDDM